jgi:hypothetical protein
VLLICVAASYSLWDLYWPQHHDLRQFEPNEVARLETDMWRAYYDSRKLPVFLDLAELLRTEYRMPFVRSNVTAFYAAKAAFVFKRGHSRADYEQALPDLRRYYSVLRRLSTTPFNVERASQLELEWWISHRLASPKLDGDLAALQSEIFHVPADRLAEHAQLRAEAMRIRDAHGDWNVIAKLLQESWSSLARVLQS